MNYPEDMIGAIKIKDGLFIGDSFAAQVSSFLFNTNKSLSFKYRIKNSLWPIRSLIL